MTKADLVEKVAQQVKLTKKDTEVVIDTIFDSISQALAAEVLGPAARAGPVGPSFLAAHRAQAALVLREDAAAEVGAWPAAEATAQQSAAEGEEWPEPAGPRRWCPEPAAIP